MPLEWVLVAAAWGCAAGRPHWTELSDRPRLPAGAEPSALAGDLGDLPGRLAGHDRGDDAAVQHADDLYVVYASRQQARPQAT